MAHELRSHRTSRRTAAACLLAAAVSALGPGPVRAQETVPVFELAARDVAQIHDRDGRLHIALSEAARGRLARFTADNRDRLVRVTVGGVVLVEAVVRAPIDSGRLSSAPLDDATRGRLLELLSGG